MIKRLSFLLLLAIPATALALAPSTTLTGPNGTLKWTVQKSASGISLDGSSPRWTVKVLTGSDWKPIRTEHTNAEGGLTVIEYSDTGAVLTMPNKEVITIKEAGLWDGDSVDIRLGSLTAKGKGNQKWRSADPDSGKVYSMESNVIEQETCGSIPCTHVRMSLSGLLKAVGPKWHYWFASDGRMVGFEGRPGSFWSSDASKPE